MKSSAPWLKNIVKFRRKIITTGIQEYAKNKQKLWIPDKFANRTTEQTVLIMGVLIYWPLAHLWLATVQNK